MSESVEIRKRLQCLNCHREGQQFNMLMVGTAAGVRALEIECLACHARMELPVDPDASVTCAIPIEH